ncbi:hypothetical protein [Flavobacterium sp. H122]|uniref:hypothetical protein n=1 Tax=Flavobacterium sp. H122 TaxID=2529860 RepID=UPI0010AAF621|nr:hypothetical protein [Flavobacterium sp. H122]
MNNIYKIVAFTSISALFAFISMKLQSTFVDKFAENILALLTTLFAINIASSTLIAGKLREIQEKTGYPFIKTKKSLKGSFYEQIIFIGLAFIFGLIRESKYLLTIFEADYFKLVCDSVLFFAFFSYLDIIRDIGKSLFDLLEFDEKE